MKTQYKDREIDELDFAGGYYTLHVNAMTKESLTRKSAIAAELAYRDYLIDQLKDQIFSLQQEVEDRNEDIHDLTEELTERLA